MSKKIYIDAGHGGSDPGAVNGRRHEAEDNLRLALLLREKLKSQGIKVYMARSDDRFKDIDSRCHEANIADCDYYLSIHRNSGTPEAHGVECWIHSQPSDRVKSYGEKILNALELSTGMRSRGVKLGTPAAKSYRDFGVNRLTKMPSCLVEVGFVTNSDDNKLFDKNIDYCAERLSQSLCEVLGVRYKANAKDKPNVFVPGDIVYVTGAGNGASSGLGRKSREYKNQKMRVVKVSKTGKYKYACSLLLDPSSSVVTAWFSAGQLKR